MDDILASPLVVTKIRVPALRRQLVPRTRLVGRLSSGSDGGLVLVCAPAGYGKTTLLAEASQSLQQDGIAVAWYALDPADDSAITFGSYLSASFTQALGATTELGHVAQLLRSSPDVDLQRIVSDLINIAAASERSCVLVLDDYQAIGSPAIHSAVAYLLEYLPQNMRLVIGSRSDPPLPLARMRAQGRLLEIRAVDLRFTEEEAALFLNEVTHLGLSPQSVAELETRTEGWIAGLQLAALSLSGRSDQEGFISSFAGGHRHLVQYLLEEVFGRQSKEVQSFLLSTSILDQMCGSLCDAILGQDSGGGEILKRLEGANIFVVALDDQGTWYRYHHLFQAFLQTQLQEATPERVASLHRAACEWHETHGFLREAVRHAIQTQDWEYAAAIVEQHGITMMMRGETSTAYEWCVVFPEEVIRAHPALCLIQSYALVLSYRRKNRGKIEERVGQVEQVADALEDRHIARVLMGQAATTRAFLAAMATDPSTDPREHFVVARKALDLLSADDPARPGVTLTIGYAQMALHDPEAAARTLEEAKILSLACDNYLEAVEATFHQARLAHIQGRLKSAEAICREGKAELSAALGYQGQELPTAGCLDIALGCVHLEQGRLEEADLALRRGLDLTKWGTTPHYQMTAQVALFRLREIEGRSAEAVEHLTRLEATWPDFASLARALCVQHALRIAPEDPATLAEASAWCQTFPAPLTEKTPPPGMGPYGAAESTYLTHLAWVRAQIALGNAQPALSYLERQLELAQAHGLTDRVIELSLLEALAGRAQGEDKRAWAALQRALKAAQPEGYLRTFDQGDALKQLLLEAGSRGISRSYVEQILDVIGVPKTAGKGEGAPSIRPARVVNLDSGEHLTERELELLRLVAEGASNREIAQRLVITEGTVKSHLNHVLRKLDVRNRTEAIARARGLGILKL